MARCSLWLGGLDVACAKAAARMETSRMLKGHYERLLASMFSTPLLYHELPPLGAMISNDEGVIAKWNKQPTVSEK